MRSGERGESGYGGECGYGGGCGGESGETKDFFRSSSKSSILHAGLLAPKTKVHSIGNKCIITFARMTSRVIECKECHITSS